MTFAVPDSAFENHACVCEYVGWSDDDARRVQAAGPFVATAFAAVVDDFYDAIRRTPRVASVITGGDEQIARLKVTLTDWLRQLFAGRYDRDYVAQRWRVGWRHVDIGLEQIYTNAALSRLRDGLKRALEANWVGSAAELAATRNALDRRIDLDLAIIEDAYQAEYFRRQQQVERLITIGQVAGGIAHELRNPLNVIKTSVYYLLNARQPSPEKTAEHLRRIERQVGIANGVITALSNFARLPVPEMRPFSVGDCLRTAYEECDGIDRFDAGWSLPHALAPARGDADQLRIVFANLFRNARDAMPQGGRLNVSATSDETWVTVTIADTGQGIRPEHLSRITEPLFTTKVRGIGLGLAISKAILDKHSAQLHVRSELNQGTEFSVRLPAWCEPGEVP